MKKIFLLIIMLMFAINVNAAGMNFTLSCPKGAAAGSEVSCTVKASSSTSTSICALSAKLSLSNATYKSFTSKLSLYQNNSSGFIYDTTSSCISSSKEIGILKFTMPKSGSATVTYKDIQGSDLSGSVKSTASNVSKTIKVYDSDNALSSLSLSNVSISPSFSSDVTSYKAYVDASSVTINAKSRSSLATVSGTGKKSLDYGKNTLVVSVKSESGTVKKYTIVVERKDDRNNDNTLKSLSIKNVSISPNFSSSKTSYTASVGADVSKISISATVNNSLSSFVKNYGPRTVSLDYGVNTVSIKVKSQRGETKVYSIKVTREDNRSSNNYLKSLSIDKIKLSFNKDTLTYNLNVNNDVNEIVINAQSEDSKAIVSGSGSVKLVEGVNTINVVVKAENQTTKKYVLNINRLSIGEFVSSNTNLSSLNIKNKNINFNSAVYDYSVSLNNDETKLDLDIKCEDETSSYEVLGNEELKNNSVVNILVKSTDGSESIYNIIVNKDNRSDNQKDRKSNKLNLVLVIVVIVETIILFFKKSKKRI